MNVGEIFQWDVNVRLVNTLRRHQASLGNFRTKWSSQWENHRRYVANPHHTSRRFAKILTYKYMTSHAFPGAQQFGPNPAPPRWGEASSFALCSAFCFH
jgi:hypothetical protein